MSNNVKVVLNSAGVKALLKSPEMKSLLNSYGSRALSGLGSGYSVEERNYPERAGVIIKAETYEARKENLQNNTILKSIGG